MALGYMALVLLLSSILLLIDSRDSFNKKRKVDPETYTMEHVFRPLNKSNRGRWHSWPTTKHHSLPLFSFVGFETYDTRPRTKILRLFQDRNVKSFARYRLWLEEEENETRFNDANNDKMLSLEIQNIKTKGRHRRSTDSEVVEKTTETSNTSVCPAQCGQDLTSPVCSCGVVCFVYDNCCSNIDTLCPHLRQEALQTLGMDLLEANVICDEKIGIYVVTSCPGNSTASVEDSWRPSTYVTDQLTGIVFINATIYKCFTSLSSPKYWFPVFDAPSIVDTTSTQDLLDILKDVQKRYMPPSQRLAGYPCSKHDNEERNYKFKIFFDLSNEQKVLVRRGGWNGVGWTKIECGGGGQCKQVQCGHLGFVAIVDGRCFYHNTIMIALPLPIPRMNTSLIERLSNDNTASMRVSTTSQPSLLWVTDLEMFLACALIVEAEGLYFQDLRVRYSNTWEESLRQRGVYSQAGYFGLQSNFKTFESTSTLLEFENLIQNAVAYFLVHSDMAKEEGEYIFYPILSENKSTTCIAASGPCSDENDPRSRWIGVCRGNYRREMDVVERLCDGNWKSLPAPRDSPRLRSCFYYNTGYVSRPLLGIVVSTIVAVVLLKSTTG